MQRADKNIRPLFVNFNRRHWRSLLHQPLPLQPEQIQAILLIHTVPWYPLIPVILIPISIGILPAVILVQNIRQRAKNLIHRIVEHLFRRDGKALRQNAEFHIEKAFSQRLVW